MHFFILTEVAFLFWFSKGFVHFVWTVAELMQHVLHMPVLIDVFCFRCYSCCNTHVTVTKKHGATYVDTHSHMHTYTQRHAQIHTRACTWTHTHTHTHTHRHTGIHTHRHAHTHLHTTLVQQNVDGKCSGIKHLILTICIFSQGG